MLQAFIAVYVQENLYDAIRIRVGFRFEPCSAHHLIIAYCHKDSSDFRKTKDSALSPKVVPAFF